MKSEIKNRVEKVLSAVFVNFNEEFATDLGPDDIDGWDSMSHLNLVMALGEEFEITLEFEEIMAIQTINDVFNIVENKLKSNETTN